MKKIVLVFFIISSISFSQVKFDADFESGNLNTATTLDSINYTVTTKTDIGGRWFYFRITGVENKFISVKVITSDVKRAMYSYDNKIFERFTAAESPATNNFQKTYEKDTVFVAYYTPYNYSYLLEKIDEWNESNYVSVDTIGFTDRNYPIHEIILTDPFTPDEEKEHVWIHSRTHPGETPASWHFDGIVQKLLEENNVIDHYRKKLVFHLIPFTNPEGVYFGRSRTNFDGIDVESNWNQPEDLTSTEVKILKQRMHEINNEKILKVFLNLHSQASPYCTFWIHTAASTSANFYRREYQFSNLNTSDNPYFMQSDYRESALQSKFPEGWLWALHGEEVMALTYETPYDRYSSNVWVTNENLFELGHRTVYAISEYLEISHPHWILLDNKDAAVTNGWTVSTNGKEFYSDNYLSASGGIGNNKVSFQTEMLEPGGYDVYGWWPSASNQASNSRFLIEGGGSEILNEQNQKTNGGQWNYLTEISLNKTGPISITISDESANGNIAVDAFRIIYKGEVTGIENANVNPADFVLYQNYPNPFNPTTTIKFSLAETDFVELRVFNPLGETVATIIKQELSAGLHNVIFDSNAYPYLSSGVYYYSLTTGNKSITKGMVLLK
jgi:hypothetical protein